MNFIWVFQRDSPNPAPPWNGSPIRVEERRLRAFCDICPHCWQRLNHSLQVMGNVVKEEAEGGGETQCILRLASACIQCLLSVLPVTENMVAQTSKADNQWPTTKQIKNNTKKNKPCTALVPMPCIAGPSYVHDCRALHHHSQC